ncbi:hypothetical protein J3E74DRAFT_423556 [Bipolaris maydis]|nr:hypothetical protein J3E74DRAFT_423556 [Bipolaris maydis]
MSDNTKATGLLSDLQKLDEAGRDRILDFLSPEIVKDILKVFLRQHDRGEGESGAIAPETLTKLSKPENIVPPNPPATENISGAICRVATEKQVIEIESDEENDRNLENSLDARRPSHVQREPLITDSKGIVVKGLRPKNLRVHLYVSEEASLTRLPVNIQADLMRRFKDMWSMNEHTITQYTAYTHNLKDHVCSPVCIRSMLLAKIPTFTRGGKLHKSADDSCIDTGYPCADFRWHKYEKNFVVRFLPLPQALRVGKHPEDLGYWVL